MSAICMRLLFTAALTCSLGLTSVPVSAWAAVIDTSNLTVTGDGDGDPNAAYGVPFTASISDGVASFYIAGDFNLGAGQILSGAGANIASIHVANNVNIDATATIDFSAHGRIAGPGGGNGALPTTAYGSFGGLGAFGGSGGVGAWGGTGGVPGFDRAPGDTALVGGLPSLSATDGEPETRDGAAGSPGVHNTRPNGGAGPGGQTTFRLGGSGGLPGGLGGAAGAGGNKGTNGGNNGEPAIVAVMASTDTTARSALRALRHQDTGLGMDMMESLRVAEEVARALRAQAVVEVQEAAAAAVAAAGEAVAAILWCSRRTRNLEVPEAQAEPEVMVETAGWAEPAAPEAPAEAVVERLKSSPTEA